MCYLFIASLACAETPFERQIDVNRPDYVYVGGEVFKKPVTEHGKDRVIPDEYVSGSFFIRVFRCVGFTERQNLDANLTLITHPFCDSRRQALVLFTRHTPFQNGELVSFDVEKRHVIETHFPESVLVDGAVMIDKSEIQKLYTDLLSFQFKLNKGIKNTEVFATVKQVEHLVRFMGVRVGNQESYITGYVLPVERGMVASDFVPNGKFEVLEGDSWLVNPQDDLSNSFFPEDEKIYLEIKVE